MALYHLKLKSVVIYFMFCYLVCNVFDEDPQKDEMNVKDFG